MIAPLALLWVACATAPSSPPDVFLFTVDTLRADHLPLYGYPRPTTPWITEIAADAVVFESASATSSWTVPSVGSLMTGMLPHQLGIERAPSRTDPGVPRAKLPSTALTLAERLRAGGYFTAAVTANAHLTADLGYGQGFDAYVNVGFLGADQVVDAVRAMAPELRRARRPVFLWVHLFDPHEPYTAWEPAVAAWGLDLARYGAPDLGTQTMDALLARPDLRVGGAGLPHLRALYDTEVARADDALARIAATVGVDEDDVLVITADHGEEFRDHGSLGHRVNLFEETVRVPLIARWKGHWPARRVADRVSLAAIVPTLAAVAEVPVGAGSGLAAGSLHPLLEGGGRDPGAPVVAELVRADGARFRAIYDGPRKLVVGADGPDLFDLAIDPDERVDLAGRDPSGTLELAGRLETFVRSLPRLRSEWVRAETDEAARRALKAMGYFDGDAEE